MFNFIYRQPLWLIILIMLIGILLWGMLMYLLRKKSPAAARVVNACLLAFALFVILRITVFGRSAAKAELVLMPFASFVEACVQPEMYREMLMNVFFFFPVGVFLPFVLPDRMRGRIWVTVLCAFVLSAGIEAAQYFLVIGRCEADDVIMNTLGAFLGALAWCVCRRLGRKDRTGRSR